MNRLGIELLSVFGMPPVEFVNLAAELDCQHISTGMTGFPLPQLAQRQFSLKDEPALRREVLAAMDDLLDGSAVREVVAEHQPRAIVH
ncbi:MAG: hypothetical protein WBZ37_14790, partial [Mycobacterium sp.]